MNLHIALGAPKLHCGTEQLLRLVVMLHRKQPPPRLIYTHLLRALEAFRAHLAIFGQVVFNVWQMLKWPHGG